MTSYSETVQTPYSLQNNLSSSISLRASQCDSSYQKHLLQNMKKYYEGRMVNDIYIVRINEIVEEEKNEVSRKNSSGSIDFKVRYSAYACVPKKGDTILMKVDNISSGLLIKTKNGPITGNIVPSSRFINTEVFNIDNVSDIKYKTKSEYISLQPEDVVLVKIINLTVMNDSKDIMTVCRLENMASKEQEKIFHKEHNFSFDEIIEEEYI